MTKSKNRWVFTSDTNPQTPKERPEWINITEKEELIFEPVPPTPLEGWLVKKAKRVPTKVKTTKIKI